MKKEKVCAYCRVSTDKKDQENSLEYQINFFNRETEKLGNYELVNIYHDKGLSATSLRRENFIKMLYDAGLDIEEQKYKHNKKDKIELVFKFSDRVPKFSRILVKNTSRFARNINAVPLLRKLRENGVYVDFLDKNISTQDNQADFFLNLYVLSDERESSEKSERIKFGIKEGMKNGVIMANTKIYGYKKIDKFTLEIIEEEAEIIRFIYDSYSKGIGVRRIINLLDEKGYKTRQGKRFSKSTINRILQNEKYKGTLVRNKYTTGTIFVDKRKTPEIKPKDEWYVHEDVIPAIVTKELWDKCQEVRESKINHTQQRGEYTGTTEYAGLISCGKCNNSYTRNKDRERYFFNCSLKKTQGVKSCNNINISQDKLELIIKKLATGEYYNHIASNVAKIEEELRNELFDYKQKLNKNIDYRKLKELELKLEEIDKKEDILIRLVENSNISIEKVTNRIEELNNDRDNIKKEINYIKMDEVGITKEIQDIKDSINNLYNYQDKKQLSYQEMLDEINEIKVYRASDIYFNDKDTFSSTKSLSKHNKSKSVDDKEQEIAFNVENDYESKYEVERKKKLKKFNEEVYRKTNIILDISFKGITSTYRIGITRNDDFITFSNGVISIEKRYTRLG